MITNEKAFRLHQFLKSPLVNELELTLSASIAVEKNSRRLEAFTEELKAIDDRYRKPSPRIQEMEKKKLEELDPFIVKGDDGSTIFQEDGNIRLKNDEGVAEKVTEILTNINNEYKEDIIEHNMRAREWEEFFLTKEADIRIDKISLDDVDFPKGKKFNMGLLSHFYVMIDLEDDENAEEVPEIEEASEEIVEE